MTVRYPLYFQYRLAVACMGYFAGVKVRGRILLVEEEKNEEGEGGVWAYGINPGGVCASGEAKNTAIAAFHERFWQAVFDMAEEGLDFDAFRTSVVEYVNSTNDDYEKEWIAARQEVRTGQTDLPGIPKATNEVAPCVEVVKIGIIVPSDNPLNAEEVSLASKVA